MTTLPSNPVRVLMLSPDSSFFAEEGAAFADVRARHVRYAETLQDIAGTDSELRIIAYSGRGPGLHRQTFPEGLTLIPTRSLNRLMFGPDLVRRVASALRGWRPDVVTAQSPWAEGILALIVARLTGARFLAQIHFDILSPHFAREMKFRFWRPRVARFLLRHADGIRVVASSVAKSLNEQMGIPLERIYVSPVPSAFADMKEGEPIDRPHLPVVLFVGRFVASKNLKLWVDVAEAVADELPDVRFRLVGSGPDEARIRDLVQASRHRTKFELTGYAGGDELISHYQSSDVLLLTSDHEGFGRVIVEAGIAGLPTVSTDCGGPTDLIVSGETGFLHAIGDKDALAASVLEICRDPVRKNLLGDNAKRRMESRFSERLLIEQVVGNWIKLARASSSG